jgi:phage-related protein
VAGPGNILIRVGAETGQAVSELSRVNGALGQSMTKSEKVGAALKRAAVPATIALAAIAVGAKKAVDAASNLNEAVNKAGVVFGASSKDVVSWSRTLAQSFGLSETAALDAATQFGNMLVPMGFSRKEAAAMSKQMVELAGDMASFNNASPEETLAAIQSGLAGQARPLRQYGVFLDQARIKQQALTMGLWDGKGAMDAHAKTAATTAIILKDTADAQGDSARTSDAAANQTRVLKAEQENLSATLGQSILPAYVAIQRVLLKVTEATAEHTGAVKVAVGIVAGLSAAVLIANAGFKAWTIATNIAKVATVLFSAANRALMVSMLSNPITLVVIAIVALGAALVIAYKRSETFRNIVNSALNSVAAAAHALGRAFTAIADAARAAFGWIVDHWRLAAFALGPLGAGIVLLANHFDKVRAAGVWAFNAIRSVVDGLASAIRGVIDAVQSLISWLGRIKVPKISLPHVPGLNAAAYGYGPTPAGYAAAGATSSGLTVNFYGPTDPEGAARSIARVLRAHEVRQGRARRVG